MSNTFELFDEDEIDSLKDKYLVFILSDEYYCIEVSHVIEIIGFHKITKVPDSPSFVKGVINLRGKILLVIDVRLRFGFESKAYTDRTCIIICNYNGINVGLIIDNVSEVESILPEQIELPPSTSKVNKNLFLKGIGKTTGGIKMILNLQTLLDQENLESINHTLTLET